jgi:hypothetical protein
MELESRLEQALSELASRIDGAIDFWTALSFVPKEQGLDVQGFVAENLGILQRLLVRIGQDVTAFVTKDEGSHTVLGQMTADVGLLGIALLTISDHRTRPVEEVRSATVQLAKAHASLLAAIRRLAVVFGIELRYLKRRTQEREQYYDRILRNLFQLTQESRLAGSIPQSLQMPVSQFRGVVDGLQDAGLTSDPKPWEDISSQ